MSRLSVGISAACVAGLVLSGCSASPDRTGSDPSESAVSDQPAPSGSESESGEMELIETFTGFQAPTAIALDADGNLYVSNWSGGTVTRVDTSGDQSVFAQDVGSPAGLAFDNQGTLFVADYTDDVIYAVTPSGERSVFARGFHTPTGIAFSASGELLVANRATDEIVRVDTAGRIERVAGGMDTPVGVVEDADGNLYVTNYGGAITKVAADGTTRELSGEFGRPGVGIDISDQNEIYATDNGDGSIRRVAPDGTTEEVVTGLGDAVALRVHADSMFVGTWNDGSVHVYSIPSR